jgi:hypothetical protein
METSAGYGSIPQFRRIPMKIYINLAASDVDLLWRNTTCALEKIAYYYAKVVYAKVVRKEPTHAFLHQARFDAPEAPRAISPA